MKKIGITCDPYKTSKFKSELEKVGYNFDIVKSPKMDVITVKVEDANFRSEQKKNSRTLYKS